MPAPTPIIILIKKAGAASCEALPEARLLICSIIWGAGVLMINVGVRGDLNWLRTSSTQVSVDRPKMIVGLMWQWIPSACHSQLCANTMNLGGYTGYGPHCTVGAVTKFPPFCSCELCILGVSSKHNAE